MDFTREPILESVITPKEGCKLVVRSSKGVAQEEFFIDSVEVVSFGSTFFLRSLERPKTFLVPASDYEILEVRETRMVLKNVGLDRSIKIGGSHEGAKRKKEGKTELKAAGEEEKVQPQIEKRGEKRRHYRKRRENEEKSGDLGKSITSSPLVFPSLLSPPPILISESMEKYKDNDLFKGAFYPKEAKATALEEDESEASEEQVNSSPTLLLDKPSIDVEETVVEEKQEKISIDQNEE